MSHRNEKLPSDSAKIDVQGDLSEINEQPNSLQIEQDISLSPKSAASSSLNDLITTPECPENYVTTIENESQINNRTNAADLSLKSKKLEIIHSKMMFKMHPAVVTGEHDYGAVKMSKKLLSSLKKKSSATKKCHRAIERIVHDHFIV